MSPHRIIYLGALMVVLAVAGTLVIIMLEPARTQLGTRNVEVPSSEDSMKAEIGLLKVQVKDLERQVLYIQFYDYIDLQRRGLPDQDICKLEVENWDATQGQLESYVDRFKAIDGSRDTTLEGRARLFLKQLNHLCKSNLVWKSH
jgi:hypothetical protein